MKKPAITLVELQALLLMLLLASLASLWAGHRFGCLGYICGFLAVFPGSLIALGLIVKLILSAKLTLDPSDLPPCRTGKCKGWDDYTVLKENRRWLVVCRCGGRYRKRRARFLEALPDGTDKPYMIWKRFRGWQSDQHS